MLRVTQINTMPISLELMKSMSDEKSMLKKHIIKVVDAYWPSRPIVTTKSTTNYFLIKATNLPFKC